MVYLAPVGFAHPNQLGMEFVQDVGLKISPIPSETALLYTAKIVPLFLVAY